jgi:hypothetical protein
VATSGLLVGFGGIWIVMLVGAAASCAAENAEPGHGCISPDLAPWLIIAGLSLILGISLGVAAPRRR